jgi:ribosomal protein S12 methylthiotransferase accessory factor YcaO
LACHFTYKAALLHGLLEVIERDAFMIAWLRRLSMPQIGVAPVRLGEAEAAFQFLDDLEFGDKIEVGLLGGGLWVNKTRTRQPQST